MPACSYCRKDNADDSSFCRHCGQPLLPTAAHDLLQQTRPAALDDAALAAAAEAMSRYLERFPDSAEALHVQFTHIATLRSVLALKGWSAVSRGGLRYGHGQLTGETSRTPKKKPPPDKPTGAFDLDAWQ
jgi:hypothetical protein